jgi:hypothetical protein
VVAAEAAEDDDVVFGNLCRLDLTSLAELLV